MDSNVEAIARICHEANRAYCATIGDHSQKEWEDAEQWQRDSACQGVEYAITNPNATAADQHQAWVDAKAADGWSYGPVKDPAKKQHPCMIPYCHLPVEQRTKDHLFKAIVAVFR
jgi:RyR domain